MNSERNLYYIILVSMGGMVIIALGGGLFKQQDPWIIQWQHQMFSSVCHQMPDRSLWINDQPMAVCSRCFGIYTSFFAGWLMLPVIDHFENRLPITAKILALTIVINFVDVIGNMLGFWQNTLISRMILGAFIGTAVAVFFSGSFFKTSNKKSEERYGGITTTNTG